MCLRVWKKIDWGEGWGLAILSGKKQEHYINLGPNQQTDAKIFNVAEIRAVNFISKLEISKRHTSQSSCMMIHSPFPRFDLLILFYQLSLIQALLFICQTHLKRRSSLSSSAPLWAVVLGWYAAGPRRKRLWRGSACLILRHRGSRVVSDVGWCVWLLDLWRHCRRVRGLRLWGTRARLLHIQQLMTQMVIKVRPVGWISYLWLQHAFCFGYYSLGNAWHGRKGTIVNRSLDEPSLQTVFWSLSGKDTT